KALFTKAFEYSDGWVDDARLVVLNAKDAALKGADIMTRSRVVSAVREGSVWVIKVEDTATGIVSTFRSRLLVNAAGPWVDVVLSNAVRKNNVHNVRLVQGSHIVVKKKFEDARAYFFQNPDNRIIFAIPYETDFTLIGTTDNDFTGDPKDIRITEGEIDYLCNAASEYFSEAVKPSDVVWTYSGVRPLFDDGASKAQEATRDYVLKIDGNSGEAPLLNVFGGKLTTYRRLGEHALEKIADAIGAKGRPWTAGSVLPGGDFAPTAYESEVAKLSSRYPFLAARHARRLVRLYGTLAANLLGNAGKAEDLGRLFGADLYEVEVRWLVAQEWARRAEDVLWRRTKLGLKLTQAEAAGLEEYMRETVRSVA
ncbi:MAG TPA: glycerol-3-phosphate dehydrogenase, partial [Pararhizobium sp.]|uniref:glycerol-3-phosphate dehydrogenase n=1 Tax=Pararhizobium sp. TaxID=1977563 RepID=UPI002C7A0B32